MGSEETGSQSESFGSRSCCGRVRKDFLSVPWLDGSSFTVGTSLSKTTSGSSISESSTPDQGPSGVQGHLGRSRTSESLFDLPCVIGTTRGR